MFAVVVRWNGVTLPDLFCGSNHYVTLPIIQQCWKLENSNLSADCPVSEGFFVVFGKIHQSFETLEKSFCTSQQCFSETGCLNLQVLRLCTARPGLKEVHTKQMM